MAAQYAIQPFFTNATLESYETPEGAENAKWWAEIAFTIVVIGIENYFNQKLPYDVTFEVHACTTLRRKILGFEVVPATPTAEF